MDLGAVGTQVFSSIISSAIVGIITLIGGIVLERYKRGGAQPGVVALQAARPPSAQYTPPQYIPPKYMAPVNNPYSARPAAPYNAPNVAPYAAAPGAPPYAPQYRPLVAQPHRPT